MRTTACRSKLNLICSTHMESVGRTAVARPPTLSTTEFESKITIFDPTKRSTIPLFMRSLERRVRTYGG